MAHSLMLSTLISMTRSEVMSTRRFAVVALLLALSGTGLSSARAADDYAVDNVHSSFTFKVQHLGITYLHGRFDEASGDFSIDRDNPARSSFSLSIKVDSIDTNNKKRDDHLRGEDFFNAKQFPLITFKSTAVKAVEGGYEVTGDFTMHGVTRSITIPIKGGKEAEFPKGVRRIGFTTDLAIKRTEFGMDKLVGAVGDEIYISIGLEGVHK
jgi:polyisoprenoid-binding protein YceI